MGHKIIFVCILLVTFFCTSAYTKDLDIKNKIYSLCDVDIRPQIISAFPAHYPPGQIRSHVEGYVRLEFIITKEGKVINPSVCESNLPNAFHESALKAIIKNRYFPAKKDGVPVDCSVKQKIIFDISESQDDEEVEMPVQN